MNLSAITPASVIVLCERSAKVRDALRANGVDAWSCDIMPTDGDPQWHIVGDAVSVAWGWPWGGAIMFPPCTDTAVSGARHFEAKRGDGRQQKSLGFIRALWNAPIKIKAAEQPVSISQQAFGREADQVIQPWQFGHGETKATCLWLDGLPRLKPTNFVEGREARVHRMPPSPDRARLRSQTYDGIADAMGAQWSPFFLRAFASSREIENLLI